MKRNKIWILLSCLLLSLCLTFAACGGDPSDGEEVTLRFDGNYVGAAGAEVVYDSVKVKRGEKLTEPPVPVRESFIFLGWYDNAGLQGKRSDFAEPFEGDATYFAKWRRASVYTISFDQNSAPGCASVVYVEGTALKDVQYTKPTKLGRSFENWFTDAALTKPFSFETSTVTASIKLYAKWKEDLRTFVVTFKNGEEIVEQVAVDRFTPVEQPEFYLDGFAGWMREDGSLYDFSKTVSFDMTLYAKISVPIGNGKTAIEDSEFADDETLVNAVIAPSVKTLGVGAFSNCANLETVVIPKSVTRISVDCFRGCDKLKNVTFEGDIVAIESGAFNGCESLVNIDFGSKLTQIGSNAFYNCSSLTSAAIPEGIEKLERNAFSGCSSLTSVTLPSTLTQLGEGIFRGCTKLSIPLPDTLTSVGDYAFYNTHVSGQVTSKLTSIGKYAFYGCSKLTAVTIGSKITKIGDYTFYGCTNVETLVFETKGGSKLESIGVAAFSQLNRITEIVLPEGLRAIEDNAFRYDEGAFANNTALERVVVPSTLESYGMEGGSGSAMFANCVSLRDVTLTPGIKVLGQHMFEACTGLLDISIPDSVEYLGAFLFNNCSNLEQVRIGQNSRLKSVSERAFKNCVSLKELYLPNTVQYIYAVAFGSCSSLSKLNSNVEGEFILPTGLVKFEGTQIFSGCTSMKSITIAPSSTLDLGNYTSDMFNGCSNLTRVVFGDNVRFQRTITVTDDETGEETTTVHTELPRNMFSNCSSLVSVVNLPRVEVIERGVFSNCTSLKSITIPSSVERFEAGTSDRDGAFAGTGLSEVIFEAGCKLESLPYATFALTTNLKRVEIPKGVTGIGSYGFYQSGIETLTFEAGSALESIGERCFYNCKNLTEMHLPAAVTTIGNSAFSANPALSKLNSSEPGRIVIPSTVTSFGSSVFSECGAIKYVTFDANVTALPAGTFRMCASLSRFNGNSDGEVVIPEAITEIGSTAFEGTAITNVTIGSKLDSIGNATFRSCSKLVSVTLNTHAASPNEVPAVGFDCFRDTAAAFKIYVPADSVEAYRKSSAWAAFGYTDLVESI